MMTFYTYWDQLNAALFQADLPEAGYDTARNYYYDKWPAHEAVDNELELAAAQASAASGEHRETAR